MSCSTRPGVKPLVDFYGKYSADGDAISQTDWHNLRQYVSLYEGPLSKARDLTQDERDAIGTMLYSTMDNETLYSKTGFSVEEGFAYPYFVSDDDLYRYEPQGGGQWRNNDSGDPVDRAELPEHFLKFEETIKAWDSDQMTRGTAQIAQFALDDTRELRYILKSARWQAHVKDTMAKASENVAAADFDDVKAETVKSVVDALAGKGRLPENMSDFQNHLDYNSQDLRNPDAFAAMCIIYDGEGDMGDAVREFGRWMEPAPGDPAAASETAWITEMLGVDRPKAQDKF
jgi:hypothetical protein